MEDAVSERTIRRRACVFIYFALEVILEADFRFSLWVQLHYRSSSLLNLFYYSLRNIFQLLVFEQSYNFPK